MWKRNLTALPAKKQRHDEGGERVNVFEKPPELTRRILSDILLPHSKVLVVCMGSGSEVIGALQANMTVVGIESDGAQVEFCKQRVRQLYKPPKQKGRKKKADQEEEEEEEAEEEDVDPGEVDQEMEEKGSVVASSESSSVSSCFTCKGEVDLELGGVVSCEIDNHLLHKPSTSSSSSGDASNKSPCSVGCYNEALGRCAVNDGYHCKGFFCNETCHMNWHNFQKIAAASQVKQ
eukprot:g67810.t1